MSGINTDDKRVCDGRSFTFMENTKNASTITDGTDYTEYVISDDARARIENTFTYHGPKGDQDRRYAALRDAAKALAYQIEAYAPNSREKSLAFTNLEQSIMWANKAIANNE